jgi:hypothetical protein
MSERLVGLATRRIGVDRIGAGATPGVGAGAVDEYLALQGAAVSRLVGCGVEASAAALRMRAEAHRLARDSGLDPDEARQVIEQIMAGRRRRAAPATWSPTPSSSPPATPSWSTCARPGPGRRSSRTIATLPNHACG